VSIAITTSPPHRSGRGRRSTDSTEATAAGAARPTELSRLYWDERARRFASRGAGLAAVCAYGMPWFYNHTIHLLQYLALRRWLRVPSGTTVLEIGCGVGRWSRRFAKRGAIVTGIDLSHEMVSEARRRARVEHLDGRCSFLVSDASAPSIAGRFDVVFGVTVLQHLLDGERFEAAVQAIADHLAHGGHAVLLEAAPWRLLERCNSAVFVAREECIYQRAFRRAGLRCVKSTGVDPMPFKTWFLPHYGELPRPIALAGLIAVTAAALPIDLVFGRLWARASWHRVFVLEQRRQVDTVAPPPVLLHVVSGADV
jgi:2-polyprenyl-3-methyl-5-hydroxy-6-metoxy-1,4-benzoquinol methylase